MSRIGTGLIFFAAACTQAAVPSNAGDDVAPDGGVADDGGPSDDGGGGSDGGGDPGNLAIHSLPTAFHDERGDRITFPSGAPLHDHVGGTLELPGSDCPELFKYGYLLDPTGPEFGSETATNPLRWLFQTQGAGTVDYRVRDANDAVVLPWSPLLPEAADTYAVSLFRSGQRGIPALGTTAGTYRIDVRIADGAHEATTTVCFQHRPLAPPVQITGMVSATVGDALPLWTFAANSPVSHLMSSVAHPNVYQAHLIHATASPVTVRLQVANPTATWTKTVVTDFVNPVSVTTNVDCGITCVGGNPLCVPEPATDSRCSSGAPPDPADPTTSGTLTTGTWQVFALNAATLATEPACTLVNGALVCTLAARTTGDPAKDILILLTHDANVELKPLSIGQVGEFTIAGNTYTGIDPAQTTPTDRCTQLVSSTANEDGEVFHTCVKANRFTKLIALDQVTIAFGASNVTVATALPGGTPTAPPYITGGVVRGTGFTWDSGNDDLPGSLH